MKNNKTNKNSKQIVIKSKKSKVINILLPVLGLSALAAGAITLGVALKKPSSSAEEITKEHKIDIVQPQEPELSSWTIQSNVQKAKKGDTVIFTVKTNQSVNNRKVPIAININGSNYPLTQQPGDIYTAEVKITFIENMTAKVIFDEEIIKKFTVTFDSDGGTNIEAQKVDNNTQASEPSSEPEKEGYQFVEWQLNGEKYNFSKPVTQNITLKAKWNINKYKITFKNWNGEVLSEYNTPHGTTPEYAGSIPSRPAETGKTFVFNGWDKEIKPAYEAATYIATYKTVVNKYVVQFDTAGAGYVSPQELDHESLVEEPSVSRTGYTFQGWYNGDTKWNFATDKVTSNITLTAHWNVIKVNVKWMNIDSETPLQEDEVEYGHIPHYTGETPHYGPTPGKTFAFKGWDKEIKPVTDQDVTYTATYTEVVRQYVVEFNSDGGSLINPVLVDYNTATSAPTNPTKEGYDFVEWQLNGEKYNFSNPVTSNITLNAIWKQKTFTVTWKNHDGSVLETDSDVPYGSMPKFDNTIEPTKPSTEGKTYTFSGWDKELTKVTSDVEYIATYTEATRKYTVTFDSACSEYIAPILVDYNATTKAPTTPTKTGYKLDGWYNGDTKWNFDTDKVTKNITLTARWSIITATVTWKNYNGDILQSGPVNYGEIPQFTQATPTKSIEGYESTFKGWDETIKPIKGEEPVTYTATFIDTVKKFTVAFNSQGGSEVASTIVTYKDKIVEPTSPTKNSYDFKGWYKEASCQNAWDFENDQVTGETVLYAKWEVTPTKITDFDFSYDSTLDGYVITNYKDTSKSIVSLPSEYEGDQGKKSVKAVGESAFASHDELEEVSLPSSITEIRKEAFAGCNSIATMNLENIVTLSDYAISDTGLTTIDIPKLRTITKSYDYYVDPFPSSIAEIKNLNYIDSTWNSFCSNANNIGIGDTCEASTITLLSKMDYGTKVLTISPANTNLKKYKDEDTDIVYSDDDKKLLFSTTKTKVIPSWINKIGDYVFYNNKWDASTDIVIGKQITEIGDYAFQAGNYSEPFTGTLTFEDAETGTVPLTIKYKAFGIYNYYNGNEFTFPKRLTVCDGSPFNESYHQKTIKVIDGGVFTSKVNGSEANILYDTSNKKLVTVAMWKPSTTSTPCIDIVLPDGIEIIGRSALDHCHPVKSITFPSTHTIKRVEDEAIQGVGTTSDSTAATMDIANFENVEYLGYHAIYNNGRLYGNTTFKNLKTFNYQCIYSNAEYTTTLMKWKFPVLEGDLPESAFGGQKYSEIDLRGSKIKVINKWAFSTWHTNTTLNVIYIPSTVTKFCAQSFYGLFKTTDTTVTKLFYFDGTYAQYQAIVKESNWAQSSKIGTGSGYVRVTCSDGNTYDPLVS